MDKQRIGFIGLGNMGLGMASRLAESGYEIAVYNRTRSKADPVAELGARVAESPADAARDAQVLMLSLANQDAVREDAVRRKRRPPLRCLRAPTSST